jgi:hypothetical protein
MSVSKSDIGLALRRLSVLLTISEAAHCGPHKAEMGFREIASYLDVFRSASSALGHAITGHELPARRVPHES